MEKIIEDPSIHKEEIIEEFVNVLNEVKLDDFNVQAPIILVGDIETKFIDFIGVEICDLIIDAYLVNIVNCMKIVGEKSWCSQMQCGEANLKLNNGILRWCLKAFDLVISLSKQKIKAAS